MPLTVNDIEHILKHFKMKKSSACYSGMPGQMFLRDKNTVLTIDLEMIGYVIDKNYEYSEKYIYDQISKTVTKISKEEYEAMRACAYSQFRSRFACPS